MYLPKFYWLGWLLTTLSALAALSPITPPKRSITLSLGYDESYNSNFGMKDLPLTAVQGYSWVFDQATKMTQGKLSRTALVFGDIFIHMPNLGYEFNLTDPNWYCQEKFWASTAVYHEFGHARAKRAFCSSPFKGYLVGIAEVDEPITVNTVLDIYYYSAKHASRIQGAACEGPFDPKNYLHVLPIWAGGLNNEARLSNEIANWTYRFNGHIAYFGTYLRGKTCAISYTTRTKYRAKPNPGNDIYNITKFYQKGYPEFDMDEISVGGWLSLFGSGSTYSFLKGYLEFIQTGDPTVKTFTINGFRLPDLNFYFTSKGLSLEFVTGYQVNPNLWLNLGIETVYYPSKGLEISPSFRYIIPSKFGTFDFDIGAVINFEGSVSGHIGMEWTDPVNPVTFNIHMIHHNSNTYVGERNIPNALNGDHDIEFMISASFNY